ncbi:hypothetical protein KDA_75250 [Dictyobacter alpinus]|uniref:Conjugal transfer protein TrbL n=1 Tax=Dictyobacter alpinus TaxID=2014873 RepID=A0A402BL23_9CHLR|nr:conjugal transfer protein TrbL family protein [Dictyobacter alpinus]GCE32041.1 hypothetical protein KDA_75250 [Dictyobacter alpinus]
MHFFLTGLVMADLIGDLGNAVANGIGQFFSGLIGNILNNLNDAIGPIVALMGNTPLNLTTANPVINGAWQTMVGVADAFLGLYVIMKIIQIMHGEATGTTHIPLGQFVPKVILTVILIHASSFLGQELLIIVNALCELVRTNVQDLARQVNGGKLFDTNQVLGLSVVLAIIFGFSMVRVVFQAVKRVVFFNVLYVLSGPAFLMSLDAQTAPWFQFWLRTYLVTALEQFLQFFTFGLGFQFLIATKTTGFTGFVLAIALLNLTAEIPSLMSRFASSSGGSAPGLGSLVRGAMTAAALLI